MSECLNPIDNGTFPPPDCGECQNCREEEAQSEITRLQGEVEHEKAKFHELGKFADGWVLEIKTLQAKVERMEKALMKCKSYVDEHMCYAEATNPNCHHCDLSDEIMEVL